jgi:hypothetical protein
MASPAHPTGESYNTDSGQDGQYPPSQHSDSPELADDASLNDVADEHGHKPQPLQKRRRVTRACDECRRKKIKCDGKQPCTHCTVYSYGMFSLLATYSPARLYLLTILQNGTVPAPAPAPTPAAPGTRATPSHPTQLTPSSTYDQPSNRRRNATPQYIEALESQLKRAKALLHVVFPTVDLNDPSIDAHLQSGLLPQLPVAAPPRPPMIPTDPRLTQHQGVAPTDEAPDSHLEAMVKATGQLDLDEDGNWDYHGHSSGLSFMRGLRQFGDMFQVPPDSSPSLKYRNISLDPPSPKAAHSPTGSSNTLPSAADLPSKKDARMLCDNAIIDAGAMLRVVHLPTFYRQLDQIYDTPPENYGTAEHSFLPLLYAVLSLGKLFSQGEQELDKDAYETLVDEG